MNNRLFLTLSMICLITHAIRTIYEIMKHRKLLKPGTLSFIIVFLDMILLWISWFVLCSLDIHRLILPAIIRYSGISLVLLGVITFLSGLFTIKTLESYEGELITRGIYSKIRHPMYLGFLLWLIGFPVFYGTLYLLIFSFFFSLNIFYWRYLEEMELEKRFPMYHEYKKSTLF